MESRTQLHALLDLLLTKASETGKSYSGRFQIPLHKVVIGGKEGMVNFEVDILARCNGRFIDEQSNIELDSDEGTH